MGSGKGRSGSGGGASALRLHSRNVGEVERRRRREDVGVVFGAGLLEAVQRRVAVVLGEALVLVAFPGQLHGGVFGEGHANFPAVETLAVQVAHGCRGKERKRTLEKRTIALHSTQKWLSKQPRPVSNTQLRVQW